tara:strand:+ start:2430 stop:3380 length:951 start_codon:yes stop_codon:yes gene_type:complete
MAFPIGDYSTSARAVVNNMNAVMKSTLDNKLNTTAISSAAIQARAKQRNAVTNAKALREKTKDSVETSLALTERAAKTKEQVRDLLKPAQRMAGVVGLLGTGAGAYMLKKKFEEEEAERAEDRLLQQGINDKILQNSIDIRKENKDFMEKALALLKPLSTEASNSNSGTVQSLPNQVSNPDSFATTISPKQAYDYMLTQGVPDIKAKGLLANIRGESDFQVGILGDGGESGGLFQMHGPRFTKMVANVPNWKTDWQGQIRHALQDDSAHQYLSPDMQFDSGAEAADWVLHNYERPAMEHRPGRMELNRSFLGSLNF